MPTYHHPQLHHPLIKSEMKAGEFIPDIFFCCRWFLKEEKQALVN